METKSIAKLFALIPDNGTKAVIIRRGPAKRVAAYSWDLTDNQIKIGQWLKGRIYEYLSDISSDGEHWIYSANQKGWGHTAIAKTPWLKAISFWRNVGGYGGGNFLGNKDYMLFDGNDSYAEFISDSLNKIVREDSPTKEWSYHTRLLRLGWDLVSKQNNLNVYEKELSPNLKLRKIWSLKPSNWHENNIIVNHDGAEVTLSWEWCEYINEVLYWTHEGILFSLKKPFEIDELKNAHQLYDFNHDHFSEIIAPY